MPLCEWGDHYTDEPLTEYQGFLVCPADLEQMKEDTE